MSDKKAQSRQRILEAASHQVRRSGFEGVGVVEVMQQAGLTHGGFYSHFSSRDALLAEAAVHASKDICGLIDSAIASRDPKKQSAFAVLVERYLSDEHVRDREHGCPVSALCGEMPGQPKEVLGASRQIVNNLHALVEKTLPPGKTGAAWSIAGTLIGAVQLARALGNGKQGNAVLISARADLLARFDT